MSPYLILITILGDRILSVESDRIPRYNCRILSVESDRIPSLNTQFKLV